MARALRGVSVMEMRRVLTLALRRRRRRLWLGSGRPRATDRAVVGERGRHAWLDGSVPPAYALDALATAERALESPSAS